MLARELVKMSNFRHYYFIIYKGYVKNEYLNDNGELAFQEKVSKGIGYGTFPFSVNEKNTDIDKDRFYDIGYSLQMVANAKLNAEMIANWIDKMNYANTKTKIFKISRLENYEGILYVNLRMNKKK